MNHRVFLFSVSTVLAPGPARRDELAVGAAIHRDAVVDRDRTAAVSKNLASPLRQDRSSTTRRSSSASCMA